MHQDYWRNKKHLANKAKGYFDVSTASEKDMMNHTKNFVTRMRLNREIDFNEDFRKKHMTKEYGNYEKYEQNSIKTEYSQGEDDDTTKVDKFYHNYLELIKKLPTKEAEAFKDERESDVKDFITTKNFANVEVNE